MDHTITALHSYRAITWPAHIQAGDVEEHDAMGALPAWRIKAPSADFAARGVACWRRSVKGDDMGFLLYVMSCPSAVLLSPAQRLPQALSGRSLALGWRAA